MINVLHKNNNNSSRTYVLQSINDRNLLGVLVLFTNTFTSQRPDLVKVDNRAPVLVALQVEVTHTDLTKVTRMVLVHVDTVMVLTTSKTTTTRMLSVLAFIEHSTIMSYSAFV